MKGLASFMWGWSARKADPDKRRPPRACRSRLRGGRQVQTRSIGDVRLIQSACGPKTDALAYSCSATKESRNSAGLRVPSPHRAAILTKLRAADAVRAVNVGHVDGQFRARNDPGIAGQPRQGRQRADCQRRQVDYVRVCFPSRRRGVGAFGSTPPSAALALVELAGDQHQQRDGGGGGGVSGPFASVSFSMRVPIRLRPWRCRTSPSQYGRSRTQPEPSPL